MKLIFFRCIHFIMKKCRFVTIVTVGLGNEAENCCGSCAFQSATEWSSEIMSTAAQESHVRGHGHVGVPQQAVDTQYWVSMAADAHGLFMPVPNPLASE